MSVDGDATAALDAGVAVAMALRVKGRATVATVAEATGLGARDVARLLDAACARGEVQRVSGERHAITPEGRAGLERGLAPERAGSASLASVYERFLAADAALKEQITAWQAERTPIRLAALHAAGGAAREVLPSLIAIVPRYRSYVHRFDRALAAIAGGDQRFVAHPSVDSLHQVWFELHEDLLVVLGRSRAS